MTWLALCAAFFLGQENELPDPPPPTTTVIVVVGQPGEDTYAEKFEEWAGRWESAAEEGQAQFIGIGRANSPESEETDRDILSRELEQLAKTPPETLWIVLIGHGTFDGKKAKFNLRGPDITAVELGEKLQPLTCRVAIVNCASAGGPFVNQLSGSNRVIVSATQSGFEYNYARFGEYLSQAIADESADLDKDGQTSLLEAWLAASAETREFYERESRLATEHALLDDNGDGKGTPADWFRGIHVIKSSKDNTLPDGTLANQLILVPRGAEADLSLEFRQQRDKLELELASLRREKDKLSEEEYLQQLEAIMLPLAKLYREAAANSETKNDLNQPLRAAP
jgi:hypothetical protein